MVSLHYSTLLYFQIRFLYRALVWHCFCTTKGVPDHKRTNPEISLFFNHTHGLWWVGISVPLNLGLDKLLPELGNIALILGACYWWFSSNISLSCLCWLRKNLFEQVFHPFINYHPVFKPGFQEHRESVLPFSTLPFAGWIQFASFSIRILLQNVPTFIMSELINLRQTIIDCYMNTQILK